MGYRAQHDVHCGITGFSETNIDWHILDQDTGLKKPNLYIKLFKLICELYTVAFNVLLLELLILKLCTGSIQTT